MINYSNSLIRVNKTIARRLYNAGVDVYFIPCKLNPNNTFYTLGIWENKNADGQYNSFDILCNSYMFYNCSNCTGLYISFYIKPEDAKK